MAQSNIVIYKTAVFWIWLIVDTDLAIGKTVTTFNRPCYNKKYSQNTFPSWRIKFEIGQYLR